MMIGLLTGVFEFSKGSMERNTLFEDFQI